MDKKMDKKMEVKKNGLGNILKLLRISNDLTIKELADKMEVTSAYICELESNKKRPSLKIIEKYSQVFNIGRFRILYYDDIGRNNDYNYETLLYEILKDKLNNKQ